MSLRALIERWQRGFQSGFSYTYACSSRLREVLHDDGQWRQQRDNTAVVRQSVRHDSEAAEFRAHVQSRGVVHGDLQREGARPPGPKAKQAVTQSQRAQRPGALRGRA